MNVAGSLTYDTKLDTKNFEKGLNKLNTKAVAVGNLLADAFKSVANAMAGVVKEGINYNAQMENYTVGLTTLTGSAEEANKILNQIKKDAKTTPFEVSGLTQGTQLLLSTGLNAERARDDILALGNAISATGGGNEELSRMAVNLQQIKNVGKASALDIKQFAFAGIDIYGLLADSMGITREKASELEVTYDDLTNALKYASKEGGKYYKAMENQSKTFAGQMSNLKESFMVFFSEATQPLFNFLKDEVIPILNGIFDGTTKVGEGIVSLADSLLNKLLSGLMTVVEYLPSIIPKVTELMLGIVNTIIENLPMILQSAIQIVVELIKGITQATPDLIPVIIDAIILIVNTLINNLDLIIDAGIDLILALADGLIEALPKLIEKAPTIIQKLVEAIIINLPKIFEAGGKLLGKLIAGILGSIFKLAEVAPKLVRTIIDGISGLWDSVKESGKNIVKGLWEGITGMGGWLKDKVKSFASNIVKNMKEALGIHSPSKVMEKQVGQWLPKGLAVGIEANTDSALKSIDKMNDEIMDKMANAVRQEQSLANFSGVGGSVSEILTAKQVVKVENHNVLELDGEKIYENQNKIQKNKDLQYGFGSGGVQ